MRNDRNFSLILSSLAENLPCFNIENLEVLDIKRDYLRIILSRREKRGDFLRLKKGLYTSKKFIGEVKNKGRYSDFLEFLANKIYFPSYLSLDYALYQHNLLTEAPVNFTSITKNKTAVFSNKLGNFIYHKVKDSLFCGFNTVKNSDFIIYKATKAKALFDFLYLRKDLISGKATIEELRLNLDEVLPKEKKELEKYIKLEGSKKMEKIYFDIFN